MKRLLLILIALILAACTSPVKVNNEIQVTGATLLYQADSFTKIKALSVSPGDGKIAFVSERPEFDLVTLPSQTFDGERTLEENLIDIPNGARLYLSPTAHKIALLQNAKIIIQDVASKQKRSYPLPAATVLQGRWSAGDDYFYVLTEDSASGVRRIRRLNLSAGSLSQLFSGTDLRAFDINSQEHTFCIYTEDAAKRQLVFTMPGRPEKDSLAIGQAALFLNIAHSGRQILWAENTAAQSYRFFIYDQQTGTAKALMQIEQQVLAVSWSPDDSKILLLHPHGLSVFELHNLKLDAVKVFADSSNEVRMSPQWNTDASKIYFIKKKSVNRLNLFTAAAGEPFRSMRIEISKDFIMDWSGDGRHILVNQGQTVVVRNLENGNEQRLQLPLHAVTPVRWGGAQGNRLTFITDAQQKRQLVLWDYAGGQMEQYTVEGADSVKDLAWLHNYDYVSVILRQTNLMPIYSLSSGRLNLEKMAPGDIRKICWAPDEAPLAALNGDYAAVQGQKALGIYYYSTNYIYWLSHLTPLNAAYFAWNRDGKNLIYVSSPDTGAQQVFMEQVIYLNN